MNNDVYVVGERAKEHGGGKGIVDEEERIVGAAQLRQPGDVDISAEAWIGRTTVELGGLGHCGLEIVSTTSTTGASRASICATASRSVASTKRPFTPYWGQNERIAAAIR